ncbi:hypothetical protein [Photobacterium sp. 1_MG-2023]|uniref:hypothetical protein n=1 Tax=Photobacterium sp. 1_MG-2023 TaxID=3062646 RepID=UPI0026E468B7|nr:hypothetical protein [Photobacterium sp. 1_MG-2023]MDO6706122.1 hypothetical protein [Photobacterium sp. 1_MG-2023]
MYRVLLPILSFAFPAASQAVELAVGLQSTFTNIEIQDPEHGDKDVAVMTSGFHILPTASLVSSPYYFAEDSNFGVQFQLDWSFFKAGQQELQNSREKVDLGTSVKGYAMTAVPVLFYHWHRDAGADWNTKVGIGFGAGYLDLKGHYQITHVAEQRGETRDVNFGGFGMAINVYLEANKGPHQFQLYNFSPILSEKSHDFQGHNVVMAYKYRFDLNL